jgi:hypothetical protein
MPLTYLNLDTESQLRQPLVKYLSDRLKAEEAEVLRQLEVDTKALKAELARAIETLEAETNTVSGYIE